MCQVPKKALPVSHTVYRFAKQRIKSHRDTSKVTKPNSANDNTDSLRDLERNLLRKTDNTINVAAMVQSIMKSDADNRASNIGIA